MKQTYDAAQNSTDIPINETLLNEITEGDNELYSRMVKLFLAFYPVKRDTIRDSLSSGNLKAAEEGAHSLRGSLISIAAEQLAEKAAFIEESCRRGDKNTGEEHYWELNKGLDDLDRFLTGTSLSHKH